MFNIGPLELLVLAVVGLIVLGPDKLPNLARDAARMIKTLRELANGARSQLRDELGPEFADVDLRSLNPRTAISRALLGDEETGGTTPSSAPGEPTKPVSRPPVQAPLGRNEAAPFDSDAT
ncbi:MAG: twin-arginine translocase subunit TatB [Actinobacteria bacterium]|nr:twin-arginine translocase subunit TatB [Actinomycetota bacterium]